MREAFSAPGPGAAEITRRCPVCGGEPSTPWLAKNTLRLVRCDACGMVYVNPVPADFASGRYYDREGTGYYLSPAKLEGDYSPVRFARELRLFRAHCSSGRVLDVGCSSGAFLYQLTRRSPGAYQVTGTDVSGPPLDYAESRGVPVVRGDFLGQSYAEKFDAVTFWAVLEHLADPGASLNRAWDLLRPGGLCFVLVPNLDSLAVRLLKARYRYIYDQHLNYFTRQTLSRLGREKFELLTVTATHFNPVVIWQDWRHHGREVPNTERAELLKKTNAYKSSRLLIPAKFLYALTEKTLSSLNLADNLSVVLRRK